MITRPQKLPKRLGIRDARTYLALFGGEGIDPDVAAFAAESGATDLAGLDALVKYVKSEGLYDDFVIYPMKSAQNAGSGSTVYGLGGLTTNDITLVNSPAWGGVGITFNGMNQYGFSADYLNGGTLTTFNRCSLLSLSDGVQVISAQYDFSGNQRSWEYNSSGNFASDPYELRRSSDGTSASLEQYRGGGYASTESTQVAQWLDGGGRHLFVDNAETSLTLAAGSSQTTRFSASVNITVAAELSASAPANFANIRFGAFATLVGTVTPTQRESITDIINAL